MTDIRGQLSRIGTAVREHFDAHKRVLSFHQYLDLFVDHPFRHTRDASRYLRDCFDHYGHYEVERPDGAVRRFRMFDLPFEPRDGDHAGQRSDHLVGHEALQHAVYGALQNFVREGRPNRLLLLHGPNGSAKSTFAACLMRALEDYSQRDEGALYRFSWVFPRGSDGKGIGFGSSDDGPRAGESYALLPEERIEVKLPSELREHPLQLVPRAERRRLLRSTYEERGVVEAPPDWLWNGELGHKNRLVYEALLTAYRGDLDRVLAHVQVERYYVSRRYRVGAVTIGPQMHVDASERQITADRTLGSLPASLSAVTLFETYGELVDASGGIIEYSDLLKRPLDAWKYLLLAIETGEVSLSLSNMPLNAVMLASSNELHLAAFKEHPEFSSFRGRLTLVRVPYLVDYRQEQAIYDAQIVPQVRRHVAPHTTFVAALWAVLTRVRRPKPERYSSSSLGRVAATLTPMEKARLYAHGDIPRRLSSDDARELLSSVAEVTGEWSAAAEYEGLIGASPREIRTLLLDAAADASRDCLAPPGVLERIEDFVQRREFDYLRQNPDHGYLDHAGFIAQVRDAWLDRVDSELRRATGLIDESQYADLFDRYVTHVSYWAKKERVYNEVTGQYDEPDRELMRTVEERLGVEPSGADDHRRTLISTVAAHAIDHPDEAVDYSRTFPRLIERLREAYFGERRDRVAAIARDVLVVLGRDDHGLEPERERAAKETLEGLWRVGYEESSAKIVLGELVRARYEE